MTVLSGSSAHPIFSRCPSLAERLLHVPLGDFPTPVQRFADLERELGVGELWVKRDDLSAPTYGGNKIRKLEFLLAEALHRGAREIVTFGAAGSNHALAATIHAARLRLATTLFLTPQQPSDHVRANLLLDAANGATLVHAENQADAVERALRYVAERRAATGFEPFLIPFGGTTPLSVAGLADAGLELVMQAFQGECPEPDVVYVAMGSMGTAAGIALGLAIGHAPTEVRAIRVTPEPVSSAASFAVLIEDTRDLLCALDTICDCTVDIKVNATVVDGWVEPGYGLSDPVTDDAVALAREHGLVLDATYTGKAFAALVADARQGALARTRVLFWDTFDSHDFSGAVASLDYRQLPEEFGRYFGA